MVSCTLYNHISSLTLHRIYVFPQPHMEFTIRTMPQDPSRGAQRYLVRRSSLVPPLTHARLTLFGNLVNTYSSHRIRNTSSPPPTTARSAYGTSRLRAVSRRTSATKIQNTASPPASVSREASGSSQVAKIARSTCGTCRAEKSCRYLMVTAVSAFLHMTITILLISSDPVDIVVAVAVSGHRVSSFSRPY